MAEGIHAGHRARIRERFLREGLSGFSEHEALELLLTYAIPQRDVNPLAHRLIDRFGSFHGVLEAGESELMRVDGVGRHAASLICLMPQLMSYYQRNAMGERPQITNLMEAKQYCGALFIGAHEELFYIVSLEKSGRVIKTELMHKGTVDEIAVYPRIVAETAFRHHAHSILMAHNHPGGFGKPLQADYDTTKAIVDALKVLGIGVVDHLIFHSEGVYSMSRESQCDGGRPEDFSYMLRSSSVSGRRGTLKEEGEDGLILLGLYDAR